MTLWGLSALVSPHCFAHLKSGSKNKKSRRLSRELDKSKLGSIVIGGGAFAGLALALALRQGLGPEIPVIVADPALATRPSRDPRATAIVAACRRLFEAIGAWDDVRAEAQPILDMVVTDSKLEDATRPVFLNFVGDVAPGEPFAHMVENRRLIDALVVRAEAAGAALRAACGLDPRVAYGSVYPGPLPLVHFGRGFFLRVPPGGVGVFRLFFP